MPRKSVMVALVLPLLLVATPVAADNGSISDPRGDTTAATPAPKADRDIVKAGWGHTKTGKLKHWVVVAGTIGQPSSGMGALPRLYLDVPGQVADNPTCDYFVDPVPPGVGANQTDHWKYYVQTCNNSGAQIQGPARAKRPTAHRIQLVFGKGVIGKPGHYGWAFSFPADGDAPEYDRAPNDGYKRHNL